VLGLFVEMQPGARRYVVAGDSKQTDLQRDSLLAAAAERGMPVVLPDAAALAGVGANEFALAGIAHAKLAEVAAARGGEGLLIARLVWEDQKLQWTTDWQLDWQGSLRLPHLTRPFGGASAPRHKSSPGSNDEPHLVLKHGS
jgi:hypothetical protein